MSAAQQIVEQRLPSAKSARSPKDREQIRAAIQRLGLTGLANDTKWDELISEIRTWDGWRPSFRASAVENGYVSNWDAEWFYHLPFPMIGVRWMDISCTQRISPSGGQYSPDALRLPRIVSHQDRVTKLLESIGLVFRVYGDVVRVFGYAPLDQSDLP